MGTREFFNSMADKWDEKNRYETDKIELMLNLLYIKNGDKTLDVGTGTGVLLPLLLQKTGGEYITAIDIAEKMIKKAKQKFPNSAIHFVAADVMEYPFDNGSFDHIICYSVFPHLREKSAAIARFAAALKPGGLLSVLHSASKEKINGVHIHAHSLEINSDYLLPAGEYIPLLHKNGLREEIVIDNEEMFMLCGRRQWQRQGI
ncbi:MAG: class I SAM-dependent methyltransferase [Treponema sp.]|jgi:demethylmenaquinone methyltransferase/2-methoxy-6-polyprenyl-1,4-benzoquinol methylase|nr:class I SAM-dependent methyltransferase [Treponema sp.]